MMIAGRRGALPGVEVDPGRPAQHADNRLDQRCLDLLPASAPMARFEREQNSVRGEDAAEQIADRDTHPRRPARLASGHAHQAGEALRDLIEAGVVAQRTVRTEARDATGDDPWIAPRQGCVTEAHRLHHAWAKIVDDHVGRIEQLLQHRAALRIARRDLHALLRAVRAHEKVRIPAAVAAYLGARAFDRFNLDDLGAVVAKNLRAKGTREVAREVDHFEAGQRPRIRHLVLLNPRQAQSQWLWLTRP